MHTGSGLHYDNDKWGEITQSCPTWPPAIAYLPSGHAPVVQQFMPIVISRESEKLFLDMFKIYTPDCMTSGGRNAVIRRSLSTH